MNTHNIELPTIRDELSRKSIDTLERLLREREQDKITRQELSVALDALFSAVSGLVDEGFIQLITMASDETVNISMVTDMELENAQLMNEIDKLRRQFKQPQQRFAKQRLVLETKNKQLQAQNLKLMQALKIVKTRLDKCITRLKA